MRISNGLGDNLLLSILFPHLRKKYPRYKIVVETPWKELFKNNPYIDWVTDKHFKTTKRHIKPKYYVDKNTKTSFIEQIMSYIGENKRGFPELYLTKNEIESIKRQFPFPYITICPVGKTVFSANRKEWGIDKFQELINLLTDYKFIQVGLNTDPLLENVIDGRYKSIRKTAAIIFNSMFFIGLEGGFMHLSKAVGKKSVIIFGGYIHPKISGYDENINIYTSLDCAPCYCSDTPHKPCDSMKCMKAITPQMVYEKIQTHFL